MASEAESGPARPRRIVRAVLAIAAGTAAGWLLAHPTWEFLQSPFFRAPVTPCACLRRVDDLGAFSPHLKVALVFGLVVASPVWLRQMPTLRDGRRAHLAAVALLLAGAALAYLSLREAWLMPSGQGTLITVSGYLDQVIARFVIFGLVLELPLLAVIARRGRRGVGGGPAGGPRPPR